MSTPDNYKLMTNQAQRRVKTYLDPLNNCVYICDAEYWSALTDPVWRVIKSCNDSDDYFDEMMETDWYNYAVPDLAACQALTYR